MDDELLESISFCQIIIKSKYRGGVKAMNKRKGLQWGDGGGEGDGIMGIREPEKWALWRHHVRPRVTLA